MPKDNAIEPEKSEDDFAQEKAGPAVAPDTKNSKMTPQQEKNIPKNNDPGHTA